MTTIIGISGSLRAGSFNTALLRAASGLMPPGSRLEMASIRGIPLYDGDVEANEGLPQIVIELKDRIARCDGLLLVTPEYNYGIPGVFKNVIDWLSRPPNDVRRVFGGRPVAVIGASPSGFGTILAQEAWLPVLKALHTKPWFGAQLLVSRATSVFNDAGELVDERIRAQLETFMQGFVAFAKS